jgi:flagellar biogenesis protein FliO
MSVNYWKVVISLLVVLIIMVPVLLLLKKMNFFSLNTGKSMRILERIMLVNGVYLLIAEILGKYYLLSVSPQGINILKEISSSREIANLSRLHSISVEFDDFIEANGSYKNKRKKEEGSYVLPEQGIDPDFYKRNISLKKNLNNIDKLKLNK